MVDALKIMVHSKLMLLKSSGLKSTAVEMMDGLYKEKRTSEWIWEFVSKKEKGIKESDENQVKPHKKTQYLRNQGRRATLKRVGGQGYRVLKKSWRTDGATHGNPRDNILTRRDVDGAIVMVTPETASSPDGMSMEQ